VAQTGQPYAYTGDDPVNGVDPLGLFCVLGSNPGGGCRGASEAASFGRGALSAVQCLQKSCELTEEGLADLGAGLADQFAQTVDGLICSDGQGVCPDWSVSAPYTCSSTNGSYQLGEALFFVGSFFAPGADGEAAGTDATSAARTGVAAASTGRTEAGNLLEQLAMKSAKSDPSAGNVLPLTMTDPRWPASAGWVKMQQILSGVNIHYLYNENTGATADWKFK
jgi:hypothetical protein